MSSSRLAAGCRAGVPPSGSPAISTRNCCWITPKTRSIFPRPIGRPGAECVSFTPSTAHARSSDESMNADPLSQYKTDGMPWAATAARSTPANRTALVRRTNRAPVRNRDRSSMMPARNDGFPPTSGPFMKSAVQISPTASAWNRPKASGGSPPGRVVSSRASSHRWIVRSDGTAPPCAARIRRTCAAVRAGFSIFSPAARSSVSVPSRGGHCRGDGTSALNPPSRRATTHRSIVRRDTLTFLPSGSWCSRDARSRTTAPRCRDVRAGSIAGSVSAHRHSAMSLRRCRAAAACLSAAVTSGLLGDARFMTVCPDHVPGAKITRRL